eukprot:6895330-Karenia_brevis.AAC.1
MERVGNKWADVLAKAEARKAAPCSVLVAQHRDLKARQHAICRWIGEATVRIGRDTVRDTTTPPQRPRAAIAKCRSMPVRAKPEVSSHHGPPAQRRVLQRLWRKTAPSQAYRWVQGVDHEAQAAAGNGHHAMRTSAVL